MKIYMVGGAVRDKILGLTPKDHDYVIVGATQEDETRMLAEGYKQVGQSFPVYLHPVTGDEYAFARVERKTAPGHQGFSVETADVTIEQDLGRRDLTINAMAIDIETGQLIDPYYGQQDLKDRIIRHTTDAFAEDPLRIFRVAKFMSRYGFDVTPDTMQLMVNIVEAGEVEHLAKERINAEMFAVLAGNNPSAAFKMLYIVGALRFFSEKLNAEYPLESNRIDAIINCHNQPPEYRMGYLMGFFTHRASPTDVEFRKQLTSMKFPLTTIHAAIAMKNHRFFDGFFTSTEEDVLLTLKSLGFTNNESNFANRYFSFCREYLKHMIAHNSFSSEIALQHIDKVWNRCISYVSLLNSIDREQLSKDWGPDGKAIGAAIKGVEIDTIQDVDAHYAKYVRPGEKLFERPIRQ